MASITVTCADGKPLKQLATLIEQRSKWLNETAEQSCTAVMLDVLVSIRAGTATANPKKDEIELQPTSLVPSFTGQTGAKQFCLRFGKARYVPKGNERIRRATNDVKNCNVWKWDRFGRSVYLIVAPSEKVAMKWALATAKKLAKQSKGLARHALGVLMQQSGSQTSSQAPNVKVDQLASRLAKVTKSGDGKTYELKASDLLEYAKLSLKGGQQAIDTALMKAANKVTSVINTKCKNILSFEKLDTPFPEVATRKPSK